MNQTDSPLQVKRESNNHRLLDALHHRFTGEVPFFELETCEPIIDRVMGRPMGVLRSYQLAPHDYVEYLQRTGIDAAYLGGGWSLGRKNHIDERGRVHYVDGTIKSRADFNQVKPPFFDPVREKLDAYFEAARGANLGLVFSLTEAPGMAFIEIGPTDFLIALHDDPGFVDGLMDRIEDYSLPLLELALTCPVDAFFLTGPMCAKHGPIFSREMHERFVFPLIEKMMNMISPRGIPVILHSNGDNSQFLDWFLKISLAAVHPVEPGSKNWDIYDLKARYGDRLCLCGNIAVGSVLSLGTPEEVRADTLEHLRKLAPGGGYVCGYSHDITENVPYENFVAMARAVCSYKA